MANFHLEFEPISRKRGKSPVRSANYQSGERLYDEYYGRTYYNRNRADILHTEIILPPDAPPEYANRQTLWSEVDRAENRHDSRTALKVIGSLPNELTLEENIELLREYLYENFASEKRCADYAIHEVKDPVDPTKNNVHFHLLLVDRPVTRDGFSSTKNRDWNRKASLRLWRERWAEAQNRAYERKGLDVRVTARSFIDRDIFKREPKKYLQRGDMYLERNGIQTARGDENREIEARNQKRELKRQKKREKERGRGR